MCFIQSRLGICSLEMFHVEALSDCSDHLVSQVRPGHSQDGQPTPEEGIPCLLYKFQPSVSIERRFTIHFSDVLRYSFWLQEKTLVNMKQVYIVCSQLTSTYYFYDSLFENHLQSNSYNAATQGLGAEFGPLHLYAVYKLPGDSS